MNSWTTKWNEEVSFCGEDSHAGWTQTPESKSSGTHRTVPFLSSASICTPVSLLSFTANRHMAKSMASNSPTRFMFDCIGIKGFTGLSGFQGSSAAWREIDIDLDIGIDIDTCQLTVIKRESSFKSLTVLLVPVWMEWGEELFLFFSRRRTIPRSVVNRQIKTAVGRIRTPNNVHVLMALTPRTCGYFTLYGKRDLADGITWRVFLFLK